MSRHLSFVHEASARAETNISVSKTSAVLNIINCVFSFIILQRSQSTLSMFINCVVVAAIVASRLQFIFAS